MIRNVPECASSKGLSFSFVASWCSRLTSTRSQPSTDDNDQPSNHDFP